MIIGFTGTQKGMTDWQKKELAMILKIQNCSEFVHGDCIGADVEASTIAILNRVKIFSVYPSNLTKKRAYSFRDNGTYGEYRLIHLDAINEDFQVKFHPPKNPLERNKDIVHYCDFMICAPKEHAHSLRSGTWMTIRYIWKMKKAHIIIPPMEKV